MEKLPRHTPDLTEKNIERLAELFPHVVTETRDDDGEIDRAIDFDLLRQELSDHLVEGPQERYQLDWPGKRQALLTANAPIAKTLRPVREESVDFDTTKNLFIEGDNLDALKLLQESYLGKVKLIYIDPPYNTGNDFVYEDDFAETNAEYLERSEQVDEDGNRLKTNPESNGRFHSDWLNMMYPRLKLARALLSSDGIICMSIDDGEHATLTSMATEIFGPANYLASVTRVAKKTSNKGTHFAPSKDHIVVFARDALSLTPLMDEVPDEYRSRFRDVDARGNFATVGLYQASLDPLRGCKNQRYWIECPDGSFALPPGPNRPSKINDAINRPPESRDDRVWRWSYESYSRQRDLLVFKKTPNSPLQDETGSQSRWNIYTKYYLDDRLKDGIRPRDYLDSLTNDLGTKALNDLGLKGYFDFAKPPQLIKRLMSWINDENALILDFFCGSASTAQAVIEKNAEDGGRRRFILIQIAEEAGDSSQATRDGYATIPEIARRRVELAGESIPGSIQGRGFRTLRVDSTNYMEISTEPDELLQDELLADAHNTKLCRNQEDLLFECLIGWGLELTLEISTSTFEDHEVLTLDDGALIACFDEEVDSDLVREIANREPLRAVFRDSGFKSDADRINAEQIFKELSPATDVKVI